MRNKLYAASAILSVIMLISWAVQAASQGLEVRISTEHYLNGIDTDIKLLVNVRNTSLRKIRFPIERGAWLDDMFIVSVIHSGIAMQSILPERGGIESFMSTELRPGEAWSETYLINDQYDMKDPGAYDIEIEMRPNLLTPSQTDRKSNILRVMVFEN